MRSEHPGYRQATRAEEQRESSSRITMTGHRVIRNGSVWSCMHCPQAWPFPAPLPDDPGPCVTRTWGDGS